MTITNNAKATWPTTQITLLKQIADCEDKTSWENFVRIYAPLIVRYCRRRGLHEVDAADVLQEVLLQLANTVERFQYDGTRGRFRNWLGTVTHRAMLKHMAKWSRRVGELGGSLGQEHVAANLPCQQPLDGVWVEAFNAHVYQVAIQRLRLHFDEETWTAFNSTFVDNRRPEEVATELHRTIGWVYQAKSKVARRLKEEILFLAEDSVLLNMQVSG